MGLDLDIDVDVELKALNINNDQVDFEMEPAAEVSVQTDYHPVGTAGSVEELDCLNKHHRVCTPLA